MIIASRLDNFILILKRAREVEPVRWLHFRCEWTTKGYLTKPKGFVRGRKETYPSPKQLCSFLRLRSFQRNRTAKAVLGKLSLRHKLCLCPGIDTFHYYNNYRMHQGIGKTPVPLDFPEIGVIKKKSILGGLHHHCAIKCLKAWMFC